MSSFEPVPTRASLLKQNQEDFNFVVYESRKRRTEPHSFKQLNLFKQNDNQNDSKTAGGKTIDLRKAQKDVINLGLSGITDKGKKDQAEIALAVKLGAKPPKKPNLNYKEILEKKREEKLKEATKDPTWVSKKYQSGATQSFQKYGQITTKKNIKKSKKQPKKMLDAYGKVNPKDKKKLSKITKRKNKR